VDCSATELAIFTPDSSDRLAEMRGNRSVLFKGRHFEARMIVLCVRWYLRFGLSFRDLEEMMAERSLKLVVSSAFVNL
jgi:hypothetical protein